MSRRQYDRAVRAAIEGHPVTVARGDVRVNAWLEGWGGTLGSKARIRYYSGSYRTVPQADLAPLPCPGGCDWCQP